jgi:hypothetical protein
MKRLSPTRRLLILSLTVALWLAVPLPVPITPGAQQTVITRHPRLCVHTRLTDEVETWKVKRTLEMVRLMGAQTIVEYFPWAYVQPTAHSSDFSHPDRIMRFANAQGLRVIARVGLVPHWARPRTAPDQPAPTDTHLDPHDYQAFADYLAQFAQRYHGQIAALVVWNEPNLALEWGYRAPDPSGYLKLLQVVYPTVKAVAPDLPIVAGTLAPTLEPSGSPNAMNDLTYLSALYANGFSQVYDVLGVHAYGMGQAFDQTPSPSVLNYRRVELVRQLMVSAGDGHKPIYITESGWNDSPRWVFASSPAERIHNTLGSYQWAEAHWQWADVVCSWAFRYPARYYSYFDHYSFVTPEFEALPIYEAVREWAVGQ